MGWTVQQWLPGAGEADSPAAAQSMERDNSAIPTTSWELADSLEVLVLSKCWKASVAAD